VIVAVAAAAANVSFLSRSPLRRLPLVVPFGVNPQGTGLLLVILTGARTRQEPRLCAQIRGRSRTVQAAVFTSIFFAVSDRRLSQKYASALNTEGKKSK